MGLNDITLWTAVITPMNSDSSVDYPSLEKVLRLQDEANNGILILGSTGEALNLDEDEKKDILNFTLGLGLRNPIMCGVGGVNMRETLNWVSYLETLKLDAYLMVTPMYAKPGTMGQYEWFKALMDRSTRPVMLYNVPGRTGGELSYKTVEMLRDHKNFWAIKEASGSPEKFAKYVSACSGKGKVFSGDDGLMPDYAPLGAYGLVSVAGNSWPKETNLFVKKCLNNTLGSDEKMWKNSCNSLFLASNPVPVKALMNATGVIKNNTMRLPLDARDLADVAPIMECDRMVKQWYANNN
ncbi:dihydrodipicolinate synthase [Bacteriovorax sp. BSW11_IV]|uniref:4-hydroxy-tetrahydrodipicolinate synthase n=1 Tax=Bacteriovorax sp. BSW11_IV TaxID=1353529 RepID=UPI00038A2519|nr:4-hydroxy-tetrahydrodipicolinate synthase [Bacteriovorax sp. BSW11_IV]EQC43646.1 dihydrodipicolinate synthase [Bacteriovorax sp. BSW11_IV]